MNDSIAKSALAWLLTYAMHSTLLLSLAWIVSRRSSISAHTRDFLWKVALVGGVVTSLAQTQLGVHPVGSLALSRVPAVAPTDAAALDDAGNTVRNTVDNTRDQSANQANDQQEKSGVVPPANVLAAEGAERVGVNVATSSSLLSRISASITTAGAVVIAWGVLAFALALFFIARRLILVGRLANRRAITDGPLPTMLDALCRSVGYRRQVRLTAVNTISSPVALGMHEICVPEAALTDLEPEQQRGLLAHELAHLARRDPLWLNATSILERVFFFQPMNRLARVELQRNAEYLCDDWAATQTGSGLPLAHCLERVAEWIEASPLGVPVAGMAEQRSLLVTRIARLIEGKRASSSMSKLAMGAGALALMAVTTAAAPGVQSRALPAANYMSSTSARPGMDAGPPTANNSSDPRNQRDPRESQFPGVDAPTSKGPRGGVHAPTTSASDDTAQEDPVVIAALIERLKDTDASVRRAAANSLGNLKSRKAVQPLIAVLADRNREVRAAAVEALANIEDASAVPALSRLLTDDYAEVRKSALDALGHFAEDLRASQVTPALQDANAEVRAKAAELLGEIGDRSAASGLLPLLKDANAEVRHETVHALAQLNDRSVGPSIVPMLSDVDPDVRGAALEALRELKVTIADKELLVVLADQSADVRRIALEYVKENPSPSLVPTLRKMLEDGNSDVRQEAVEALSEIRDPAARAALRDALNSEDPKVRRRAAEALGERP